MTQSGASVGYAVSRPSARIYLLLEHNTAPNKLPLYASPAPLRSVQSSSPTFTVLRDPLRPPSPFFLLLTTTTHHDSFVQNRHRGITSPLTILHPRIVVTPSPLSNCERYPKFSFSADNRLISATFNAYSSLPSRYWFATSHFTQITQTTRNLGTLVDNHFSHGLESHKSLHQRVGPKKGMGSRHGHSHAQPVG